MTQWTSDQLTAITAQGSDLLVSAAAGSGKTRSIGRTCDSSLD